MLQVDPQPSPDEAARSEAAIRRHYDMVPFPASPRPMTHPDRMGAIGVLFGIDACPVERCRVLEVGCADGGNIMPIAANYPSSHFVGIDLSPCQIESGRRTVAELGLTNIELTATSITDFAGGPEPFDYIIAHGFFSWVPRWVQDAFLGVLRNHLAPSGIAYVSYNTYPGWHFNQMIREMMLHHVRNVADPLERAAKAFELVRFLAESAGSEDEAFAVFLRHFSSLLDEKPDFVHYFVHEFLEENNAPMYFGDFVKRIEGAGLQYIADADPAECGAESMPEPIANQLRAWATSPQDLEQYVDFARNNRFRRSLLCRKEVRLDRTTNAQRMRRLHVSSPSMPADPAGSGAPDGKGARFHTPRQRDFTTDHRLTATALRALFGAWPSSMPFDDLAESCRAALAAPQDGGPAASPPTPPAGGIRDELAEVLSSLFLLGALDLHAAPVACVRAPGVRPAAPPLARMQALRNLPATNQRHRPVKLDDAAAHFILTLLDGSRDRAAIALQMEQAMREGRLRIEYKGQPLLDHPQAQAILRQLVEHRLQGLAGHALIVQ